MPKYFLYLLILLTPTTAFSQQVSKRIIFKSDSIWYAADKDVLFSSVNKGIKWDTIFGKRDSSEIIFFEGDLDTARNVFVSDQHTIFVFGWDGTMLYQTILYCSSNGGKTWNKTVMFSRNGTVGVKYLHKISSSNFFLYLRDGYYMLSEDSGKTWTQKCMVTDKFGCFDPRVSYESNGNMSIRYSRFKDCSKWETLHSTDGGITWK